MNEFKNKVHSILKLISMFVAPKMWKKRWSVGTLQLRCII